MPSLYTEADYENSVIELFENMGYTHVYGPDIERDFTSPLYDEVLEESIRRYSELDEYGRKAVDYILSCEHNRCAEQGMLFDVSNLVFSVEIKVKPTAEEIAEEPEEPEPCVSEATPEEERDC